MGQKKQSNIDILMVLEGKTDRKGEKTTFDKNSSQLGMVAPATISALGRLRQENLKFEASLD
jgi:5S rRNA maturation endonuclease (ribonuclease M5)